MGPVVLGGVRHLDTAGGKFDFSCSATVVECSMASRSRWTVLKWWDSPYCNQVPNPALPKHVLKGPTNRLLLGAATPCQQKDNHNLWFCSSPWVSIEHNPIPALSPSSAQHTQECTLFLISSFLEPAQVSGGGKLAPRAAVPVPSAVCYAAILTPKTLISNGARYKDGKN